jgi:hypothetical protein
MCAHNGATPVPGTISKLRVWYGTFTMPSGIELVLIFTPLPGGGPPVTVRVIGTTIITPEPEVPDVLSVYVPDGTVTGTVMVSVKTPAPGAGKNGGTTTPVIPYGKSGKSETLSLKPPNTCDVIVAAPWPPAGIVNLVGLAVRVK